MRVPDRSHKSVVVGMSGGVDSSVAAALLKEQGYKVIGLFMKNWEETDESGQCHAAKDYEDVARVCDCLDIPYYSVEFVKEYWDRVFSTFLEEIKKGHTPNPDILCNREIKFKVFFDKAMELGADYLATGHYCRRQLSTVADGEYELIKGVDANKDQTYFLYTMKKEILSKVLFPVGDLQKSQVRKVAQDYGLSTQSKKDSTGICFIGERPFRQFLFNYIKEQKGNFELLNKEVVGQHQGACFYTIGQRKGLGLGGQGEPWFVVGKDISRNVVIVERGVYHPALFYDELWATDLTWVHGVDWNRELPFSCKAKVRYRQQDQQCRLVSIHHGVAHVIFPIPQRGLALGQSIVFYDNEICLGGGVICRTGANYYQMGKQVPSGVEI